MSGRSTVFKIALACIAASVLLLSSAAVFAAAGGSDIITVPQLLTARGDRDSRCLECIMGDAVADALRTTLHADVVIVNGGDLKKNLLPGETTYAELQESFAEDHPVAVAHVTPKQLRAFLEIGLSHITLDKTESIDQEAACFDYFPQISGFKLYYDATALPMERVYDIKIGNRSVDLNDETTILTLASTEFLLGGGTGAPGVPYEPGGPTTLSEALVLYFDSGMERYSGFENRIVPLGTRDHLNIVTPGVRSMIIIAFAVMAFLMIIGAVPGIRRREEEEMDDEPDSEP